MAKTTRRVAKEAARVATSGFSAAVDEYRALYAKVDKWLRAGQKDADHVLSAEGAPDWGALEDARMRMLYAAQMDPWKT